MIDQRGNVISHELDVDGAIDVSGAAVALQVDGDHLMALRELRKNGPEHFARPQSAVQEDHRTSSAMSLVIEVEAVNLRVLAGPLNSGSPIGLHARSPFISMKTGAEDQD